VQYGPQAARDDIQPLLNRHPDLIFNHQIKSWSASGVLPPASWCLPPPACRILKTVLLLRRAAQTVLMTLLLFLCLVYLAGFGGFLFLAFKESQQQDFLIAVTHREALILFAILAIPGAFWASRTFHWRRGS
jgi:hypothetical protein